MNYCETYYYMYVINKARNTCMKINVHATNSKLHVRAFTEIPSVAASFVHGSTSVAKTSKLLGLEERWYF